MATRKPVVEFSPDIPVDLASFYARKGGVDLGTLSELTKSVGVADKGAENTRSKRTCVRVREEISKLQDILNEDFMDAKPARGGGRGKGRGSSGGGGRVSNRSVEFASDDAASGGSGAVALAKKKRPLYSQFTRKRRKRKRKTLEEGKVISTCSYFAPVALVVVVIAAEIVVEVVIIAVVIH